MVNVVKQSLNIKLLLVHMTPRPNCIIGGSHERYVCYYLGAQRVTNTLTFKLGMKWTFASLWFRSNSNRDSVV